MTIIQTLQLTAKILTLPLLLRIAVNDIKTKKISNAVHPIFLCLAIFLNNIPPFERLTGALISALPFFIYSHKTGKTGMGDVKLIFSFGWCIGMLNVPLALLSWTVFFFSTFKRQNTPVPYAPYLCGTFAVGLFLT